MQGSTDSSGRPLRQQRARPEQLLVDAPPTLALCPQTLDVALARVWFDELAVTGSEGLVVKDLDGVYRAGGRSSTSRKIRSVGMGSRRGIGARRNRWSGVRVRTVAEGDSVGHVVACMARGTPAVPLDS